MSFTDILPVGTISRIKYVRDEFHRETGIRRYGAGSVVVPIEYPDSMVLVQNDDYIDRKGEIKSRLEVPGGGIGIGWAALQRLFTAPEKPFHPLYLTHFLTTARKELQQETGINPKSVEYTGAIGYSYGEDAGPDNFVIAYAIAPYDVIAQALAKGPSSNEVSEIGVYTASDTAGQLVHHAVDTAFTYINSANKTR